MPVLSIQTNAEPADAGDVISKLSAEVASMLGKPESYVMVGFTHNPHMLFAGSSEPLAYVELKSIGLPEERCAEFSSRLCEALQSLLGVDPGRIYIEFSNAERHLFGWDSRTF